MTDEASNTSHSDASRNLPLDIPLDPTVAIAELARIRLSDADFNAVMVRIAELTKASVRGASEVSVTILSNGVAGTVSFTGELAEALDEKQYDTGYGPCLDAARNHRVHLIRDMATDTRWPAFARNALELGVRSSLSAGIRVDNTVSGGLNVYSTERDAFDEDAKDHVTTFAGYAAVALANAHLHATAAALADQMAQAMESRAAIEQAKGILIAQRRVSPDEAFNIMSRASQVGNRKLRDIAEGIVAGAQAPPTGEPGN